MKPQKYLIIDLMLKVANNYGVLNDLDQFNQIRVLNNMVYLCIYQQFAQNYRYEPEKIQEYFEFDEYEFYSFKISSHWLSKFNIIDTEYLWVEELLHISKEYIFTVVLNRADIGASTVEFYLLDNSPLASSVRSITVIPKPTPAPFEPIKLKSTVSSTKPKNKVRIIKKNDKDRDFDR